MIVYACYWIFIGSNVIKLLTNIIIMFKISGISEKVLHINDSKRITVPNEFDQNACLFSHVQLQLVHNISPLLFFL